MGVGFVGLVIGVKSLQSLECVVLARFESVWLSFLSWFSLLCYYRSQ